MADAREAPGAHSDNADRAFDPGEIIYVGTDDGKQLAGRLWRADGNAPLLVAVHGVMSHSLWFRKVAAPLQEAGLSLLAVDRRGAGMNRHNPGEPSDDQTLIDDLDRWIDHAKTISGDVHLVGFCWGSNYALHYLGQHAERVQSLIVMSPGIAPMQTAVIQRSIDDLAPDEQLPIPLDIEDFTQGPDLEGFLRQDPLRLTHTSVRFIRIQQQIGRWSAVRFARFRKPLLLILADQDLLSDNERTLSFFEKAPAPLKDQVTLPGRHGIIFDAPEAVAANCRHWVDRLRTA